MYQLLLTDSRLFIHWAGQNHPYYPLFIIPNIKIENKRTNHPISYHFPRKITRKIWLSYKKELPLRLIYHDKNRTEYDQNSFCYIQYSRGT